MLLLYVSVASSGYIDPLPIDFYSSSCYGAASYNHQLQLCFLLSLLGASIRIEFRHIGLCPRTSASYQSPNSFYHKTVAGTNSFNTSYTAKTRQYSKRFLTSRPHNIATVAIMLYYLYMYCNWGVDFSPCPVEIIIIIATHNAHAHKFLNLYLVIQISYRLAIPYYLQKYIKYIAAYTL